MDAFTMPYYYLSLIILFNILKSHATLTNETESLLNDFRKPRVTGRIVKLYSGPKPEPFLCSGEGFKADPSNCAVFYRCVRSGGKYSVFKYQCAPGTVFDSENEVCNYPQNTKRSECGGNTQDFERLVEKIDSEKQQEPAHEIPRPISTKIPIYSEKPRTTPLTSSISTVYPWLSEIRTPSDINPSSQITMAKIDGETHSNRRERSDPCTKEGFVGDSEDCRKFYRCVNNNRGGFVKYEFSCNGATIWDDDSQNCNHAWAVRKRSCGSIPLDETTISYSEISNDVLFDDKTNDKPYGSKVNKKNKGHSEYSDQNNLRDKEQVHPTYNNVVSNTNRPTPTPSPLLNSEKEINRDYSTQTTITVPNNNNIMNTRVDDTNDCKESGFMADQKECRKFYRCVDNGRGGFNKYEFTCGEGTAWDYNIEACNYIGSVKSCGESSRPNEQSTQSIANNVSTNTEEEPIQNSYGGGEQNNQESDQSNVLDTTTTTEKTDSLPPSDSNNDDVKCTSSGFIGDPKNCKVFYRCVDNGKGNYTKYEYKCGEGTVWDSNIEACNHEWAVQNCSTNPDDSNKEESTSSKPATALTTVSLVQVSSTMSSQNVDYYDGGYGQKPSSSTNSTSDNSNNNMECTESGFMADVTDCQKFYRCVEDGKGGFTKYEFLCGEGTIWDPSIEACNYEGESKKCASESNNQNQEVQTESTMSSPTTSEDNYGGDNNYDNSLGSNNEPAVAESPNDNCNGEGFFGDKNDCKKFYRCVENPDGGYKKYEFTCGEGTVWDQNINACNHATKDNKCSKENNAGTTMQMVLADEMNTYTTTTSTESHQTITTTESHHTTTTNEIQQGSNEPQTSSDICKAEGFYGDSTDCKKFYRCVDDGRGGYTRYEFTCGEKTVWDQSIQGCNHDNENNNCSKSTSTQTKPQTQTETSSEKEKESTTSTSTSTTTPTTSSTERTNTSSFNNTCPSEGFFADPNDCQKFYRCVNDDHGGYTKYDFACGEGTIWVQEIQACDHDNDISSCKAQSGSSTTSTTTQKTSKPTMPTSTTQHTTSTANENNTTDGSSTPTPTNNGECTSEGFFPNKQDCTKFYRCVSDDNGGYKKYDFACGEATAWDTNIQACNYISEVDRCSTQPDHDETVQPTTTTEKTTQATQGSSSTTETSKTTTKPSSTTSSSTTSSSTTSISTTSSSTTPSSTTSTLTTTSTSGPSTSSTPSSDKCEKEGYYGNSKDCKKFYRCVDDGKGGLTKYDFDCGEGTIWDQDKTTCNHPQDVSNPSCKNEEVTTTSSTTTTAASQSSSQSGSSTSQGTTTSTESSTTQSPNHTDSTKKPDKNVTCDKAGFYPDPNDCKKFYRCVDWDGNGKNFSVFHFECGEGTIWDPAVQTCNHEDSVYPPRDCSNSNQTENVTDSTTTTTEESTTTTEESTTTDQTTAESTTTTTTTKKPTTTTTTTKKPTTSSTTTTTTKKPSSTTTTTTKKPTSTTTTTTTTKKPTSTTTTTTTTKKPTTSSTTTTTTKKPTTSTTTTTTTKKPTTSTTTTTTTTTKKPTTSSTTTTTTEQSTTSGTTEEPSTTEQPTTTEESTTQASTTEETTTQSSTTTEQTEETTQQSTTQASDQSTTQESDQSTQSQTTTQQTTEESTTQESTTQAESTTTDNSSTTTESNQESTTEDNSSSNKECPETDDDQYLYVCPTSFRRHPKYCNLFYQCDEDDDSHEIKIANFRCPNDTIYDEKQNKCVEESKAEKKCDGKIAQRRKLRQLYLEGKDPIEINRDSFECTKMGNFELFKNKQCSPAFLKCTKTRSGKLRGFVYQCPKNYVYWSISRRCERKSQMHECANPTDINWQERREIPIERKNIAT